MEHGGGLYGGGAAKTADRTLMQGSPRGEPATAKEYTGYALDVTKYLTYNDSWLDNLVALWEKINGLVNFHYDWRSHTLLFSSISIRKAKAENSIYLFYLFYENSRRDYYSIIIIISQDHAAMRESRCMFAEILRERGANQSRSVGKTAERRIYKIGTF